MCLYLLCAFMRSFASLLKKNIVHTVRSIVYRGLNNNKAKRKPGSLANIGFHLPDVTRIDVTSLCRAIKLELGDEVAEYGKRMHRAFENINDSGKKRDTHIWDIVDPSPIVSVDARYIIATYNATISAGSAYYNPRRLLLTLLSDFTHDSKNKSWRLADILGVISIASVTDDEVKNTAGLLKKSIIEHNKTKVAPSCVPFDLLNEALAPIILDNFRGQLLSKLTSTQRLNILNEEEVSLSHCKKLPLLFLN